MSNEHITDERLAEVLTEAYGSPEWTMADVRAARAVEAASLALRPAAQTAGKPMTSKAKHQWVFIRESLNKPSMYADRIGAFVKWFDATHKVTPPSNQPARTE